MKIGLQKEWNNNAKEDVKLERKVLPKKEVAFTLVFQASLETKTSLHDIQIHLALYKNSFKTCVIQELNVDAKDQYF
jgi:hypothetical protein